LSIEEAFNVLSKGRAELIFRKVQLHEELQKTGPVPFDVRKIVVDEDFKKELCTVLNLQLVSFSFYAEAYSL